MPSNGPTLLAQHFLLRSSDVALGQQPPQHYHIQRYLKHRTYVEEDPAHRDPQHNVYNRSEDRPESESDVGDSTRRVTCTPVGLKLFNINK